MNRRRRFKQKRRARRRKIEMQHFREIVIPDIKAAVETWLDVIERDRRAKLAAEWAQMQQMMGGCYDESGSQPNERH